MLWFKSGYKQTDTKDRITSFTQAGTRENINSGEKHKTLFGKIAKYFSDLKPVAFTGSYNDLQDKPLNLAPAAHRHSKSDITDFPSSLPASDVYSWAKASSKPAYTASEVGALPVSGGTVTGNVNFDTIVTRSIQQYSSHNKIEFDNQLIKFKVGSQAVNRGIVMHVSVSDSMVEFYPSENNGGNIGNSNQKWTQIYAVNSAISTSDRNEKKEISYIGSKSSYEDTSMTDEELTRLVMGLRPVVFKRINGESGRPHHGFISQDFEELMKRIGLHDHAAFIKSPKIKEVEVTNEDGNKEIKIKEIPGEYTYGIRYEELISDVIRFCQILKDENDRQQNKIEDLEKRMEILENVVK